MKTSSLIACAVVASFALAGCGRPGSLPPPAASAFMLGTAGAASPVSNGTPAFRRKAGEPLVTWSGSWMSPEAAKSKDLLYISDWAGEKNVVDVFSYPAGKYVGHITNDMLNPDGLCVDKNHDIWVVNNTPNQNDMVEFEHGKTTPIATLGDPGQYAVSCAVDPKTGDLAVTGRGNLSSGAGSVSIFPNATGNPRVIADPEIFSVFWCAYDDNGNLFVDGQPSNTGYGFVFAELPKGSNTFKNIVLKGGKINFPGAIQWTVSMCSWGIRRHRKPAPPKRP